MKHIALLLTVALIAGMAQAFPMVTIKETVAGVDQWWQDAGTLIQTDIQDAYIDYADEAQTTYAGPHLDGGATWVHDLGTYTPWGVYDRKIVVGINNLTDELLPLVNGSCDVKKAELVIYRSNGWASGEIVNGYRLLTDWMWEDTVADNEGYDTGLDEYVGDDPETGDPIYEDVIGGVSMAYTYDDGVNTYGWGDGTVGFTAADYTTVGMGQFTTVADGDARYTMDITDIVKAWYDEANYGLVLMLDENSGGDSNPYWRPSESTGMDGARDVTTGLAFHIWYAPEPATMGLLAIGGIAALLRRKRS